MATAPVPPACLDQPRPRLSTRRFRGTRQSGGRPGACAVRGRPRGRPASAQAKPPLGSVQAPQKGQKIDHLDGFLFGGGAAGVHWRFEYRDPVPIASAASHAATRSEPTPRRAPEAPAGAHPPVTSLGGVLPIDQPRADEAQAAGGGQDPPISHRRADRFPPPTASDTAPSARRSSCPYRHHASSFNSARPDAHHLERSRAQQRHVVGARTACGPWSVDELLQLLQGLPPRLHGDQRPPGAPDRQT